MKHGLSNTRLYSIFRDMKRRCYNPNFSEFKAYGGKGIIICDEWLRNFQSFYDWAMTNGYQDDLTIDRINSSKIYSPDNCRWLTLEENSRNRSYDCRNLFGDILKQKDLKSSMTKRIMISIPQELMDEISQLKQNIFPGASFSEVSRILVELGLKCK